MYKCRCGGTDIDVREFEGGRVEEYTCLFCGENWTAFLWQPTDINIEIITYAAEAALSKMDRIGQNSCHIGDDWYTRLQCEAILGLTTVVEQKANDDTSGTAQER